MSPESAALESTESVPISEAKTNLSGLVDAVRTDGEARVIVRHSKPAAVLVSVEDWVELRRMKERRYADELRAALSEGTTPLKTVLRELERVG